MPEKTKKQRRRTFIYLWVLFALLILLVTATYTWFTISQTPHVNDMAMYINTKSGIEIAKTVDAEEEEWGLHLDYYDLVDDEYPLKPVTWSEQHQKFMAMRYGFDGRMMSFGELSDEKNANRKGGDGYYVHGTFYVRTQSACYVSLAKAIEINGGENGSGTYVIGLPLWNVEKIMHEDVGNGAENAIRLGLKITHVDYNTGTPLSDPEFFIYEPNCDYHLSGSTDYFPTASIDGTDTLIDSDHLILQKASSWSEAYPIQREVTIKKLGDFVEEKRLFKIETYEKIKVDVYVWLEGQDADCIAQIDDSRILASIQFNIDYSGQSGIEDIPDGNNGSESTSPATEKPEETAAVTDKAPETEGVSVTEMSN